jgi:hypothetical protein
VLIPFRFDERINEMGIKTALFPCKPPNKEEILCKYAGNKYYNYGFVLGKKICVKNKKMPISKGLI